MMPMIVLWTSALGRRLNILLIIAIILLINALLISKDLSTLTMQALTPPPPLDHELTHFIREGGRRLDTYFDDLTDPLIEPSQSCTTEGNTPLVALVTSAPHRVLQRDTVRSTWGKEIPTYFFLGLPSAEIDEQLVDYYVEAKQYSDIIVCDFVDAYHNLTLKTACMLQWVSRHCPQAGYVLKTDDDVLVNPWRMEEVLKDNEGAALIGYVRNNSKPHRDPYVKWYLPRWLYSEDDIPQYLTGPAYLINGADVERLYRAAFNVPLINLEDVYFTYLVANKTLSIALTHDDRVSPYKPMLPAECAYWSLATLHSLSANEMLTIWAKIKKVESRYNNDEDYCQLFNKYFSFWTLLF